MIRRVVSLVLVAWALGFLLFAVSLPRTADEGASDAIVVPTGGGGRIQRGIALLRRDAAKEMLVTGVFEDVKPGEFAAEYEVPPRLMACCVTLGFAAINTRGNARETAAWVAEHDVRSIRLVTSDWHMRRAALELEGALPDGIAIVRDPVRSEPSLWIMFLEYHKLLAAWFARAFPG